MQEEYSWNGGKGGSSSYRLPENEGQGKWVLLAIIFALLAHVVILVGLSRIDVVLPDLEKTEELQTHVIRVNPVDTEDARPEITPPDSPEIGDTPAVVPPADELEILESLPEMEFDISPDIETIQVPQISPAAIGALEGESKEAMKATIFDPELPEMGETTDFFPRANDSQVTVDPGARMAEEFDPDAYTDTLRKGVGGESEDGLLKGFASLDQMARMDGNALLTSKALIGSDLLFEFNSAELKQSARVSLMKVAMLIYKHPNLVCWLDGHTDLIGGDVSNMKLSEARALAVKEWLTGSMELSEDRIAVRGFGKTKPLIKEGDKEAQAPNRRVEIKMRKGLPASNEDIEPEEVKPEETEPTPVEEVDDEPILVKPKVPKPPRAIEEVEEEETPTRALVVPEEEEAPAPRRAIPVPE